MGGTEWTTRSVGTARESQGLCNTHMPIAKLIARRPQNAFCGLRQAPLGATVARTRSSSP